MDIFSGGSAEDTIVYSGGLLYISGLANHTELNGNCCVTDRGIARNTRVSSGGYLLVVSSSIAKDTQIFSSGYISIGTGGIASSATINSCGSMYVSHGKVQCITVSAGGLARIVSSSYAFDTVLQGGILNVEQGAQAFDTVLSSGTLMIQSNGFVSNTRLLSGGFVEVASDGVAYDTVVDSGGKIIVSSGGTATDTTVNYWGYLYVSSGGTANNTMVNSGGDLYVRSGGTVNNTTVNSSGYLRVSSGGTVSGDLKISNGATVSAYIGAKIDFTVAGRKTTDDALINNWSLIDGRGNADYTVTVKTNQKSGTYKLAAGASGFANTITVKTTGNETLGTLTVGSTLNTKYGAYTLNLNSGSLTLKVEAVVTEAPRVNFKQNGVSQILAWDAAQGKVGYMATDGNVAPGWQGVWEWSGSEASMWKVVGAGHFSGSEVEQDGVLLYNGYGNTFAAWTNLNDGSYGYVSLCHVDGNFQTKCLADFDNNGFDDVIIYDENGSVGIVSDAAAYHDVWHVDNPSTNVWQLVGTGRFSGDSDSIVFKNTSNNHLYLWDNQDLTYTTWNWSLTDIGSIADGWEVAAIGDFQGDGIDDIALINHNDNDAVFVWDDGDCSTSHYVGCLGSGFKIESVGDYNGDGKEDLLLREYNSGWGGVGYWASADAGQWTDLNARIETNMESKFAIIA